jgi:hypothetical protein
MTMFDKLLDATKDQVHAEAQQRVLDAQEKALMTRMKAVRVSCVPAAWGTDNRMTLPDPALQDIPHCRR